MRIGLGLEMIVNSWQRTLFIVYIFFDEFRLSLRQITGITCHKLKAISPKKQ
jgi:hypothetical protein